jgi:uncharacterized protein
MALSAYREFHDNSQEFAVRGFLHGAMEGEQDCLVLTHGAGADCTSPLLVMLADAFYGAGAAVLRCDLPFRQARPQGPPPRGSAERDQKGLRAAVAAMRSMTAGRVFLGGHSYGGRQASMASADDPDLADGLLLLSYPLHPPQRPSELRTAHFPQLHTRSLFVHGTRDGFGSTAEMKTALQLIPARSELLTIEGSGHELLPRRHREETAETIMLTFRGFVNDEGASYFSRRFIQ